MYHSSSVRRHGIRPDLGRRLHSFSGRQTQVGRGTGYMCAAGYNTMYKSHTISIVTATNYISTDVSEWVESLESCDCHRSFISSYTIMIAHMVACQDDAGLHHHSCFMAMKIASLPP